jgi:hypothetical protein
MRAMASLAPPAACGTTKVTGLLGYLSWAIATPKHAVSKKMMLLVLPNLITHLLC